MKQGWYKEESQIQNFLKNIKGLTFEKKIEHILTYYWGTLLIMILIPVILVLTIRFMLQPQPDLTFNGNCCNVTLNDEGISYMINDWNQRLDMEPGTLCLNLDFSQTAGVASMDVDGGLQVIAAVAADDLDYILCDSVGMEFFSVQCAFLPLEQIFTEETLSDRSEEIYYYTDEEDGTVYAAGLDVSNMPFIRDCVPESDPVYLIFANKVDADTELLRQFWSHMESWVAE